MTFLFTDPQYPSYRKRFEFHRESIDSYRQQYRRFSDLIAEIDAERAGGQKSSARTAQLRDAIKQRNMLEQYAKIRGFNLDG